MSSFQTAMHTEHVVMVRAQRAVADRYTRTHMHGDRSCFYRLTSALSDSEVNIMPLESLPISEMSPESGPDYGIDIVGKYLGPTMSKGAYERWLQYILKRH